MQQAPLGRVVAVADQQPWRVVACVQRHAVRGAEFLEAIPFDAKVHQVLAGLVELEDVIAGVTVGQNDVAVRSNRDRRRTPLGQLQAGLGFRGNAKLQNDIAGFGVNFESFACRVAGTVQELGIALRANFDVVDVRILVTQKSSDDLAFG